ncbi:MAG: hypothetical protein COV35_03775 [Alphaproteobacteria bacterium CG11_big_fil_rev_8_21_14_0_20_39_49]|nr:MAG: hypothetical protein COV35_03775 [Alphaproteobacteria bacterium CG11_big_fil_rev_8_21_14_0_20_39_49]
MKTNKNGVLLILDMDKSSARLSKDILEQLCSNDVIVAETITTAKGIMDKNDAVFVIINFLYNNDECLNFIKAIRSDTEGKNYKIPILTFIENNTNITAKDVLNTGASKCIIKPFDHQTLKNNILDIINNPKNFIMTDNYIGPDRRNENTDVKEDKRNKR